MPTIKPLGKRVLVKRLKAQTTKGGILLPETAREKPKEGIVVSVGPGQVNEQGVLEKPTLQQGQRVLFSLYAGTEFKDESGNHDEEFLILSEDDVLGILS